MKFKYTIDMSVDTLSTGRTYHTPDGSYPSLTTILGKTANNPWLEQWKQRVGEEEAARVSKEATDRGTLVHSFAERHFNGEYIWEELRNQPLDVRQMSRDLIKIVEPGLDEIYGQEQILWSNKYRYAGRTDMVGVWKGTPAIIDFKTSKKPKQSTQIRDYFIQCCGYAVAHNEMFGTGINQIVVAITIDGKEPQLFEKPAAPFLYELQNRRATYDKIISNN
jgi:ATP-dependent exoDNAse (exonuclease V) beta subunit